MSLMETGYRDWMLQENADLVNWTRQSNIFQDVKEERLRQDQLWGSDNHLTRSQVKAMTILIEEVGEVAHEVLEQDREKARTELVQVAAVAVAMIEAIDHEKEAEAHVHA